MDRTVQLNDNWLVADGGKKVSALKYKFGAKGNLPVSEDGEYVICRKFICPKQINDTVKIFFTGKFTSMEVFADKVKLTGEKDDDGFIKYDVTPCLTKGIVMINAVVKSGTVDGFYFSVKRKV